MLSVLIRYKKLFVITVLLSYLSGIFSLQLNHALHLLLHIDDILQSQYVSHNHQEGNNVDNLAHSHEIALDFKNSDDNEETPESIIDHLKKKYDYLDTDEFLILDNFLWQIPANTFLLLANLNLDNRYYPPPQYS